MLLILIMEYCDYRGVNHDDNHDGIFCYRPTYTIMLHKISYVIPSYSLLHGWIKVPRTSAIRRKADQDEGIIHIIQDVVRQYEYCPAALAL